MPSFSFIISSASSKDESFEESFSLKSFSSS